nr:EOG090X0JQ4 [Eulimnadia texana]
MPEILCEICERANFKYKCPKCLKKYCSLPCYKIHSEVSCIKPTNCPAAETKTLNDDPIAERKYDFTTEDTVPIEKLRELDNNEEMRACLANPHVRKMLNDLVHSSDVEKSMQDAMREPIFLELANACLKVVQNQNNDLVS